MFNLENRIRRLEKHLPKDLIIVCRTVEGKEVKLSVSEFEKCNDLEFVRVASGNNVEQLDKLLPLIVGAAF